MYGPLFETYQSPTDSPDEASLKGRTEVHPPVFGESIGDSCAPPTGRHDYRGNRKWEAGNARGTYCAIRCEAKSQMRACLLPGAMAASGVKSSVAGTRDLFVMMRPVEPAEEDRV